MHASIERPATPRRRLRPILLWLFAAAGSLAVPAVAEPDRAPVLLRKSMLLTPEAAAGTGLAPEVKVRVSVDDRGRVAEVATLGITPASRYDELFLQTTREEISTWRYAPAIEGGKAAATTLEWTVKFQARDQTNDRGISSGIRIRPAASVLDAEARRARVLALPLEQRKELLRQQAEIAEKHLDRARRRRADSPRFVVVSDAEEPKTAEILAGNMEAIYNVIQGLFGSRIVPQPESYKIVVYLYASRASFDAMKAVLDVYEWSIGFYSPAGLVAFHLEAPSMESLLGTMMHEATHAFVDRHLVRRGDHLPRWLGEGFAEYLGNSEVKKGELIPGKTPGERFVLVMGYGAVRAKPEPRLSLEEVKRKVRRGQGLSVEQLMTADADTFYGERRSLYYPSSWLLVHFLRHGEAGWAESQFPDFMLYVAEGYPAADAVETVYGATPAELEDRFRSYVLKQF